MDNLENLQRRITEAFQRIETAAKAHDNDGNIPSDPMRRLAETNVALAVELDAERATRLKNAAILDKLITRLKPMLNEATHA